MTGLSNRTKSVSEAALDRHDPGVPARLRDAAIERFDVDPAQLRKTNAPEAHRLRDSFAPAPDKWRASLTARK